MWFCCHKVCFAILTIFAVCCTAEDDTIVDTKQGKVSGVKKSVVSKTVKAYLGIPYAEAPTGEKRFKKPEPRAPWQGIYEATTLGSSCSQDKGEYYTQISGSDVYLVKNKISEDCLTLNIWVPQSISKPAHVMTYIHGGGFISGTSAFEIYDGSVLAASESMIVVSMNYRLGALGFLAFPKNVNAPGNAAMFDQRLALQWVHENIAAFGGNPESITIFGESAGAGSVGYHVISSGSQPFFKRAILQSGSPTAFWAINSYERSRKLSLELAKMVNCPTEDDDAAIACLQKVDAKELVEKQILIDSKFALTLFVPVVDNDFVSDIPKNLVKHSISNIDVLIGVTKNDGNPFPLFGAPGFNAKNLSLITTQQLKKGLKFFFPTTNDLHLESMMLLYKDWDDEQNMEKNRDALERILKDIHFTCPSKYFANSAAKDQNKIFVYEYDHRPSIETYPEWMGVVHASELPVLFGQPLSFPEKFSNKEQVFSRRVMKMWANFAREGNPSDDKFNWPQYLPEEQKYAILKADHIEVKQKWNSQKCQFWNSFYPKLVEKMTQEGEP
ncbi:cholinesterase-like [Anomaloglossus baeobatrachus]|uniref:cholinesterase-like n=1 Tax=Anomaloglossus baeobatrachus TaxID=238106 RepID=UPI003F501179